MKARTVLGSIALVALGALTAVTVGSAESTVTQFPPCYQYQIAVGTVLVYSPPPAGTCDGGGAGSTTTEVTSSSTSSTTTAPASTTTTSNEPTSTVAPPATSTTIVAPPPTTTSTSVASSTTTSVPSTGASGCGLSAPAFCETFDRAYPDSTSRTGDLDAELWGVSRSGAYSGGQLDQWYAATLNGAKVSAPNDVRVIGGKLTEAVNDGFYQTILAMYPKQPFNFAGRTGTAVFDVSADTAGSHAAWPEFWITDQPVPYPNETSLSAHAPQARNSFGVKLHAQCTGTAANTVTGGDQAYVSVGSMSVTRNYVYSDVGMTIDGCVREGTAAALNHFEVRVSPTSVTVWGSDPGGANLRQIAHANVAMPLTQGLIWIEDVHYNACKFNNQCDHQFTWDNVGFDGPKTYRDLTFDIPDRPASGSNWGLGWNVGSGVTLTVNGVHHGDKVPTGAYIVFGLHNDNRQIPNVSVNGSPPISTPFPAGVSYQESMAVPIDPALLHDGANTIRFTAGSTTYVDNVNAVLVNAGSVP